MGMIFRQRCLEDQNTINQTVVNLNHLADILWDFAHNSIHGATEEELQLMLMQTTNCIRAESLRLQNM